MKKSIFIVFLTAILVIALLFLTGCDDKKDQKIVLNSASIPEVPTVGSWETILTDAKVNMNEEVIKLFEEAKKNYIDQELEAVALLGSQVVAGTNRMFLAKGYKAGEEKSANYKIVTIYTNLENKSEITNVTDFKFSLYTNENIEGNDDILAGGWTVTLPAEENKLDEKLQAVFDKATSTLAGIKYYPIAAVGKQPVAGTKYAILCYAVPSYGESERGTINLITIYEDLVGTSKILTQTYINLADFNK